MRFRKQRTDLNTITLNLGEDELAFAQRLAAEGRYDGVEEYLNTSVKYRLQEEREQRSAAGQRERELKGHIERLDAERRVLMGLLGSSMRRSFELEQEADIILRGVPRRDPNDALFEEAIPF